MMKNHVHGLLEGFFIDGHLNGNVRKVPIDSWVRSRLDGGVIFWVMMILCNGPDGLRKDAKHGHGEELRSKGQGYDNVIREETHEWGTEDERDRHDQYKAEGVLVE
jgi:hypothetical protein